MADHFEFNQDDLLEIAKSFTGLGEKVQKMTTDLIYDSCNLRDNGWKGEAVEPFHRKIEEITVGGTKLGFALENAAKLIGQLNKDFHDAQVQANGSLNVIKN